jgi:hypothetical protein
MQEIKSDPTASAMSVEVFICLPPIQTWNNKVPLTEPAPALMAGLSHLKAK